MAMTTSTVAMSDDTYRRELGDGLVLRWSTPEDVERVATLYSQVFRRNAEAPPSTNMPIWTRDMFSGRHPHIGPHDFAVVEQADTGVLVAASCLLRYGCVFEDIPFGFGRPEVVATLPEYRNRGLIRAIFALLHAKSDGRGDLVQGITGIPYFYRQFGYEYAAELAPDMEQNSFIVYFPAIPRLKADEPEPYTLRPATVTDIPALRRLWDRERAGTALSTPLTDAYWRWLLEGMHPDSLERWSVQLLVDVNGRVAGSLLLKPWRRNALVYVDALAVEEGVPLTAVVPSVLRGVREQADTLRVIRELSVAEPPAPGGIAFRLPGWHPLRAALGDIPHVAPAGLYGWYLRVADLPGFIRHVAPALERRLAASPLAGYTGEVTLDFYRGGLRLAFQSGRLTAAEEWRKPLWGEGKAGFPPLVFLQLLFGHRTLDTLRRIYPDVWAEGEAAPLLAALFPQLPARLLPLD